MTKTIYTRIINKKITSVELKSVLGRELYICNNGNWTDVLNEFSFSYTAEQFCQYIADYEAWAELNNVYVEILEGKAKHREIINKAKELLKEFLDNYDYSFFPELYKTLSAKEKQAVVLVLRHSELYEHNTASIFFPSTSELSLLWKDSTRKQKHRTNLIVPIQGNYYELTVNMFTGEVVEYVDMDIIEGNFN